MKSEGKAQSVYEKNLKIIKDLETKDGIIYKAIVKVAEDGGRVYYGEIAPLVDLDMKLTHHRGLMGAILERISRREHSAGRPLLTAVVIKKMTGIPGKGFFKLAKCLRLQTHEADADFWEKELKRVHDYWRGR